MYFPRLTLAVARHVLGNLLSDEIPRIADDLLNHEIYADGLARLYDMKAPLTPEIGRIFESSLRELAIEIPSNDEACTILLRHHIRSMIEGVVTPFEALANMRHDLGYHAWWEDDRFRQWSELSWRYDDGAVYEMGGVAALDKEVLSEASTWHRQNSGITVSPGWLRWNNGAVRRVAETVAKENCFEALPVLADALEEAGCIEEEVLGHLRDKDAGHVRCCWVVGLILGGK
jgi:hypothetical protein